MHGFAPHGKSDLRAGAGALGSRLPQDGVMAKKLDGLREDIAAAASKLPSTIGGGRELKKLVDHLWEDERVEALVTGIYGGGMGLLTLTNRRLLFTKDGRLSSTNEDFPLERVSSVQWSSGMTSGKISIFTSGNKAEVTSVDKAGGKSLVDHVRDRIAAGGTPAPKREVPPVTQDSPSTSGSGSDDTAAQLRRLAELHSDGILTDDEFAAKKAQILDRM